MGRDSLAAAKRIVVKVGSSSLTAPAGELDLARVAALAEDVAAARASGREVVLVSSGAVAAAIAPLGLRARPRDLASQQAAASVGQGLLIAYYTREFARHGMRVGQVLLSVEDVVRRATYRNAYNTITRLLELGVLPVINENDTVATHELRFGDNDRLAALVAQLVHADALLLLSDVDGLHTSDPRRPGAKLIEHVADISALDVDTSTRGGSRVGTGGMAAKLEAAHIATSAGVDVLLTRPERLEQGLMGLGGTYFAPSGKRRSRRLLWLAHATHSEGQLFLDDGAVRAVVERKASLLPAGITRAAGEFSAGDPVDLVRADGEAVARGLVGYSSEELPLMIGRTTAQLADSLGPDYERAVVHRDALVILPKGGPSRRRAGVGARTSMSS